MWDESVVKEKYMLLTDLFDQLQTDYFTYFAYYLNSKLALLIVAELESETSEKERNRPDWFYSSG